MNTEAIAQIQLFVPCLKSQQGRVLKTGDGVFFHTLYADILESQNWQDFVSIDVAIRSQNFLISFIVSQVSNSSGTLRNLPQQVSLHTVWDPYTTNKVSQILTKMSVLHRARIWDAFLHCCVLYQLRYPNREDIDEN